MNKNTAGAWEFRPKCGSDMGGIYSPTDRVCWFGDETRYYPTEGDPPGAEDARLIAAAPDLLHALEMVRDAEMDAREDGCGSIPDAALSCIQAAIEKANGDPGCSPA